MQLVTRIEGYRPFLILGTTPESVSLLVGTGRIERLALLMSVWIQGRITTWPIRIPDCRILGYYQFRGLPYVSEVPAS